jgi:MarR family transcriptional regulator, transcriptional regulator for hemolysin
MAFNNAALGFLVSDVARLWRKRFEQRAASLGFTRSQWQVMVRLAKNEGIHQAALAEILEVEPISLVRILDKLEARGLIERRQHPRDRRVWLLYLTPEAHPSLSLLRDISEAARSEVLAGITEEDQERLSDILTRVKLNLVEACAMPVDAKEAHHG